MKERAEALVASPIGCLFTLLVAEHDYAIGDAVAPPLAYIIASGAVEMATPHCNAHDRILEEALERGGRLRDLASRLVEHPKASWWFEPLDRQQQLWTGEDELAVLIPTLKPTSLERYAQRPVPSAFTSTFRVGTTHLMLAMEARVGDWDATLPQRRLLLEVAAEARVFEIDGPGAWHRLCSDYPAFDGSPPLPRLVPDWSRVASEWDGVHLSFGGLLTAEQTRSESDAGWSMLSGWAAETTLWLHDVFAKRTRLNDWVASQISLGVPGMKWVDDLLVQSGDALKWFERNAQ